MKREKVIRIIALILALMMFIGILPAAIGFFR